jgi:hypothetical protein
VTGAPEDAVEPRERPHITSGMAYGNPPPRKPGYTHLSWEIPCQDGDFSACSAPVAPVILRGAVIRTNTVRDKMKRRQFSIAVITVLCAGIASAVNIGFLPGDATFRVSMPASKWKESFEEDRVVLPIWYSGGVLCGYAGQWSMKFESFDEDAARFILQTLADDRFVVPEDHEHAISMPSALVCFTAKDFDLTKHKLSNDYNIHFRRDLGLYPDGRSRVEEFAKRREEKFPIPEDRPSPLNPKLPFDPEASALSGEYDASMVAPKEFKIIIVSNAYAVMLEEISDDYDGAEAYAKIFDGGEVSEYIYRDRRWKLNPRT